MNAVGLGQRTIAEFKTRNLWGTYFTFDQYQKLKKLKTEHEVRDFFRKIQFGDIKVSDDAPQVVDDIVAKKEASPGLRKIERVGDVLIGMSFPEVFLPLALLFVSVSAITWIMKRGEHEKT